MDSTDEELELLINKLDSKWTTLHNKYKKLKSSTAETTRKNKELELRLAQARCQVSKAEEENNRLNVMVRKLHKDIFTGSLYELFSTLKRNVKVYEEAILPSVKELTKNVTITSPTSAEQHLNPSEGLVTSSSADSCISSTTSFTKIPTSNETKTKRPTNPPLSVPVNPSQNTDHMYCLDIPEIDLLCVEEQVDESPPAETKEQPDVTIKRLPSMKRSLSPPLDDLPSSPKRTATRKMANASSSSSQLKCLYCEYNYSDDPDNTSNTFATRAALEHHISLNHSDPNPSHKRCMFNNGACTKQFSREQNFNQHVKQAHPNENSDSYLQANQDRLSKCTICDELFVFESNLNEHNKQVHNVEEVVRKLLKKNLSPKKKHRTRKSSPLVNNMKECEVCKKENRSSTTYRLYNQLDAHISKCHSDPFPDYLRCPYCRRHFKQVNRLTQHIVDKHSKSYVSSPLEKFLLSENTEGGMGQEVTHDTITNTEGNTPKPTSKEEITLKILTPTAINNKLQSAMKSTQLPFNL